MEGSQSLEQIKGHEAERQKLCNGVALHWFVGPSSLCQRRLKRNHEKLLNGSII